MRAKFSCELKPSQLNDAIRQFMSDIAADTAAIAQEKSEPSTDRPNQYSAILGSVCYASKSFIEKEEYKKYWQLADGSQAQGELKTILGWENVPNLIGMYLEISQDVDEADKWIRHPSNNKKHMHAYLLAGETNNRTSTSLWRGDIRPCKEVQSRPINAAVKLQTTNRTFEVVGDHKHTVTIVTDGDKNTFRPRTVLFAPFICHTRG